VSERILVECDDGVYELALEDGDAELARFEPGARLPLQQRPAELVPAFALAHVVDLDACGSAVALLLSRRPPLLVSADTGLTWSEAGGGLPAGRAIAFGPTPDDLVYATRNRLYLSTDGGRFWRSLAPELPEIRAVAWETP
jgi:hypothetical protein